MSVFVSDGTVAIAEVVTTVLCCTSSSIYTFS